MCCGFWTLFTGNIGRSDDFSGWFDYIIDLAFFIPPFSGAGDILFHHLRVRTGHSDAVWVVMA
ncbi:MAG: hypothetical protein ABL956_16050 [Hyphomonadaceae bacterium]